MATPPEQGQPSGGGDMDDNSAVGTGGPAASYKRASRKGLPRRFQCDWPECDKVYSRAEHLQRHQLNHDPKRIFACDVDGCNQKFVRLDLLSRHKKRHSSSYIPRNRPPSFNAAAPKNEGNSPSTGSVLSPQSGTGEVHMGYSQPSPSVPHDAAILLTPDSGTAQPSMPIPNPVAAAAAAAAQGARIAPPPPAPWPGSLDDMSCNIIRPKPGYYPPEPQSTLQDHAPVLAFPSDFGTDATMNRDNFAMWLFDPQATYGEFSVAHLPFIEGGLESPFNNNIHYDYESLTSRSQLETPPGMIEGDESITEYRRREILRIFHIYCSKQPKGQPLLANNFIFDNNGDCAALNLDMLRECYWEYWEHVSSRLPVIHQATFSCNRCPALLLMVMLALGAASLRSRVAGGNVTDYINFADTIIINARWEILTAEEASPPVGLWVAQALLLLEFYEKMYSSRRLHERAHIYHSATLTLLRRGSPLIGRSGSESPPDEPTATLDSQTWWTRWAETEAMHRVVFAAFCFDTTHAAMFGHSADMAPHEIRLPLPCDDNLWTASRPDDVRQLDANLRMYGVKPVSFLDGLKRALHGKEVRTHSFGRMIIMCGLLSVGWHLSHRETQLKWFDLTTPSLETQDNWRKILLKSFDNWKDSYDIAQGSQPNTDPSGRGGGANGPIQSAAVLYHLAHISLHVDIVDCQVYAGARRLLGRKVSSRDYRNAVTRMKNWSTLASTRHAILHAFKLLHLVLVDQRRGEKKRPPSGSGQLSLPPIEMQTYSCRSESDPHRPWIMYYAALSIWSFVRALNGTQLPLQQNRGQHQFMPGAGPVSTYRRVVNYLSGLATLSELTEATAATLGECLPELLDCLQGILGEAHPEILKEAHERLRICRDMLLTNPG